MLTVLDRDGLHVESNRDPAEQLRIAEALVRKAASILRDSRNYSPAANDLRRNLDNVIRLMSR